MNAHKLLDCGCNNYRVKSRQTWSVGTLCQVSHAQSTGGVCTVLIVRFTNNYEFDLCGISQVNKCHSFPHCLSFFTVCSTCGESNIPRAIPSGGKPKSPKQTKAEAEAEA
jgi:hypothetical protein